MDSHFRGDPQARCRHACRATRSLFSRGEYKLERAGPQSEKSCRLSWRHQGDECPPGTGPALGARGAWPRPATVGGRAPVAAQHARGRCPGGVRLAGELGPKPDGGDGEGGGGGRAARLEHVGEVGGEPGVGERGGPPPGVQARQRAEVGPSGVDADRGVGELTRGRRGDGQRPRPGRGGASNLLEGDGSESC